MSASLSRARGVIAVGTPGCDPSDALIAAFGRDEWAGYIPFKRNVTSPSETRDRFARVLRAGAQRPPLVAIDQEGGRVARLGPPTLALPPARALGELDDDAIATVARGLGAQLAWFGCNADFAPVLDVDTNPDNPVIGDRSFGRTPEVVIAKALAFARGLREAGIAACGKHFPGHGDTDLDSHLALPRLRHDRARLESVELPPFRAAAEAKIPMIMSAHVVFDAVAAGRPATLSPAAMTELLRQELGYEGVIVSDDLEMKAVAAHARPEENAIAAIEAGCDLLLFCKDLDAAERAADALADRASTRAGFRRRLDDARQRIDALRETLLPEPRDGDLTDHADVAAAEAVLATLRG